MQHSRSHDQSADKPKSHRQGKPQPTQQAGDTNPPQQTTISELVPSFKHGSGTWGPEDCTASPLNKRQKRDHTTAVDCPTPIPVEGLRRENMSNHFPVAKTHTNGAPGSKDSCKKEVVKPANFTPHIGARKLVIKNLRKIPRASPEEYFNRVWDQLDAALSAIFTDEKVPYSLEELYRGVENLCRQDKAPALFQKLLEKCKHNVTTRVKEPLVAGARTKRDDDLLRAVVEAWSRWNTQLMIIRSVFFYLDRSYLLHSPSQPSLEEMGISQFRGHIFADAAFKSRTLQGACDLVEYDRQGREQYVDNSLFQKAIQMFHDLGVYAKDFEPIYLRSTQSFLVKWRQGELSVQSLAGYVEACRLLFDREIARCDLYRLDESTRKDLVTNLDELLIAHAQANLVEINDVSELLDRGEMKPLEQLFSLLERKCLADRLRPAFEAYINTQGSSIVFDEAQEDKMVIRLLEFKRKLDTIWRVAFQKHEGLGHSLREAFESFINKTKKSNMTWGTDNPKPGEMIAKYVDMILRGGAKAIPAILAHSGGSVHDADNDDMDDVGGDEDVEISRQLDQVLDMFRFVHGKAVFEAFYKRDLARRLLMGRSASADAEKSMLTRLKSECGAGFTHNLEQMFKDIELAREEITSYKTMLEERPKQPGVDLNVNVLSASAWPTYPDVAVEVPPDISKAIMDFEQHYRVKHTGRKLTWKHALAHCQLKASFPKGNKEIVVSSFQAIVMLLFNGRPPTEAMPYTELQAATNLTAAELKRTLQSLACAKYRVLTKSPKGKEVNDTDTFTVNLNFSDPKYRIKINSIQLKETKEENKETHERVAADRHYETQAAIVRIMKSRKTITHPDLVAEVIKATKSRGVLDPVDIKKNIEKLIEKDYMEREENNTYTYLA